MPAYYDKERKYWSVQFWYTDWTGTKKKKHKRGFKLKREAEEWEREFLLSSVQSPNITFSTLVEQYYKDMENRIRSITLENKISLINLHMLPYFGNKVISDITSADIRKWQNSMLKKTKDNGEPYKPTSLRMLNSQLTAIFNYAVQFCGLPSNPCSVVKPIGKQNADEMHFWTLDEFNRALEYAKNDTFRLAYSVLFWTGIREGELLGLTENSVLRKEKALRITQTLKRVNGETFLGEPKTENSKRTVPLPDFLYDELIAYIDRIYGLESNDPIFPIGKQALLDQIKKMADKAGLQRIRVHDLRHSHVALLIELGYRTHAIAQRVGDTPTTVDTVYAHLYPNKAYAVAQELNKHKDSIVENTLGALDEDGTIYNDKELKNI